MLTWINLRGVREGKLVQTTLTVVKTGALALLIILGLTSAATRRRSPRTSARAASSAQWSLSSTLVIAFGAAMVGSLFSSDAWNSVTFAAAEVKNPSRNLPLALVLGTGLVSLLYILANVSYLNVLPYRRRRRRGERRGARHRATPRRIASAPPSPRRSSAPSGGVLMAIAILISTFGCNNGLILSGARVLYAMARDGLFFRRAGTLNRNNVPAFALIVQSIWTAILCLTGTYDQLLNYVIFAALLFYVVTTMGLFILRRTRPDAPRPYRAVGYPVLPALYILLAAGVSGAAAPRPPRRAPSRSPGSCSC